MRDYSQPIYDLGEIRDAVKRIASQLGVPCRIHPDAAMAVQGYVDAVTLSEDIRNIARKYGFTTNITGDLGSIGIEFQKLISGLRSRQVNGCLQ